MNYISKYFFTNLFMYFKKTGWFTLIELMVWISIITIIIIASSKIDFNKMSDRQKANIFASNIRSDIETVKNYALIWKWIGTGLTVPDEWKISISTNNSWTLETSYLSLWVRNRLDEYSINWDTFNKIKELSCEKLDWSSVLAMTGGTIIFNSWNMTLTWCTNNIHKIINIKTSYKNFENNLSLNTVNWVIKD